MLQDNIYGHKWKGIDKSLKMDDALTYFIFY